MTERSSIEEYVDTIYAHDDTKTPAREAFIEIIEAALSLRRTVDEHTDYTRCHHCKKKVKEFDSVMERFVCQRPLKRG